jgi:hypothetical protein
MDLHQLLRRGVVSLDRMLPPATRAALSPQLATPDIVSSAKGLPSTPAALGGVFAKTAGRVALPFAIYDTSKEVFNPQDNIITRLGALGTSIENLSVGKPSSAGRTQAQQQTSGRPVGTQSVLGGKPVYWGGDDYGWQQLNQTGSSATLNALNTPSAQGHFIQDQSSFPAAERAYQQEVSRVAQLTAQDPELKRYELAREGAKTQEDMNAARDIGMQIWQNKYGGTKMGQQGGAVGTFNPLMDKTFGYQTGGAPDQQMGAPTMGPSHLVPQVDQSLNPASPTYLGGEGPPQMNFADDNLTPEMIEAYQKQLLSQAASRK